MPCGFFFFYLKKVNLGSGDEGRLMSRKVKTGRSELNLPKMKKIYILVLSCVEVFNVSGFLFIKPRAQEVSEQGSERRRLPRSRIGIVRG